MIDKYFTISILLQNEDRKAFSLHTDAYGDTTTAEARETVQAKKLDSEDISGTTRDRSQPSPPQTDSCNPESSSPPKTASSVSLSDSAQSASHSESDRRISHV